MAEIPLLNMNSGPESQESEPKMESPKISVTDNATEKSDSFVIEVEAYSCASINKDGNSNSRITLQRSLSRKGWSDKVNVPAPALCDLDAITATCSSSPRGSCVGSTQEKVVPLEVEAGDNGGCSPQVHHQITVTTATMSTEARSMARRISFKRPSNNWGLDPKKVLLFFATLSSIGSILLIYLTFMTSYD